MTHSRIENGYGRSHIIENCIFLIEHISQLTILIIIIIIRSRSIRDIENQLKYVECNQITITCVCVHTSISVREREREKVLDGDDDSFECSQLNSQCEF